MGVESGGTRPPVEKSAEDVAPEQRIFQYLFSSHVLQFCIVNHFQNEVPKSEEKLNFGGRLGWVPMNPSPPPPRPPSKTSWRRPCLETKEPAPSARVPFFREFFFAGIKRHDAPPFLGFGGHGRVGPPGSASGFKWMWGGGEDKLPRFPLVPASLFYGLYGLGSRNNIFVGSIAVP